VCEKCDYLQQQQQQTIYYKNLVHTHQLGWIDDSKLQLGDAAQADRRVAKVFRLLRERRRSGLAGAHDDLLLCLLLLFGIKGNRSGSTLFQSKMNKNKKGQ